MGWGRAFQFPRENEHGPATVFRKKIVPKLSCLKFATSLPQCRADDDVGAQGLESAFAFIIQFPVHAILGAGMMSCSFDR